MKRTDKTEYQQLNLYMIYNMHHKYIHITICKAIE